MLVITYHSISDGPPPLCVGGRRFAEQLDFLLGEGWTCVTLRSLVDDLEFGRALGSASFALTFDDGYRDFRDEALPILEERGLPATLFAISSPDREQLAGGIGAPLLRRDEIEDVARRGIEIGAHGVSHQRLTTLADDALERELAGRGPGWSGRGHQGENYPGEQ